MITKHTIYRNNCINTEYHTFTLRPLQEVSSYLFTLLHTYIYQIYLWLKTRLTFEKMIILEVVEVVMMGALNLAL